MTLIGLYSSHNFCYGNNTVNPIRVVGRVISHMEMKMADVIKQEYRFSLFGYRFILRCSGSYFSATRYMVLNLGLRIGKIPDETLGSQRDIIPLKSAKAHKRNGL